MSIESQHTPGLWKAVFRHAPSYVNDYYNICDSDGIKICEVSDTDKAQLMAAAPELLEALQAIDMRLSIMDMEYLTNTPANFREDLTHCRQTVQTAINKALNQEVQN